MKQDDDDRYVIWSNEHRSWWLGNSAGYTPNFENAGIYTRAQALAICGRAIPGWLAHDRPAGFHEVPIRLHDIKMMIAASPGGRI